MKKAIVTISSGVDFAQISELTHPLLKRYAKRCGAEFVRLEPTGEPHFEKFKLHGLLQEFDRVLYIDSDILVQPDAPDLFKLVPKDSMSLLEEGEFQPRSELIGNFCQALGLSTHAVDQSRYFNTGVMMLSKEHQGIFAPWPTEFVMVDCYHEQTYINYRIAKLRPKIFPLDPKFNWMSFFATKDKMRTEGHFIHYAGYFATMKIESFLRCVAEDREIIDSTYTKPPEKIALKVDGGLGDHMAAEPACRYLKSLYQNDDLILISHFPELFEHLNIPNLVVGKDFIEDAAERQVLWSFPVTEHPIWQTVSHALINAYDYAAISMARGALPMGQKTSRLHERYYDVDHPEFPRTIFDKSGLKNWNDVVLLHPGRGWPTKTFPPDVWESYVNAVRMLKLTPVIIGKRIDDKQGVVEFDTSGAIDLIDQLSLPELIGAISMAPILISNDSAPIHLAGAFNNHIKVIATCKRPEYILPYRTNPKTGRESIWWRADALEVKPLYDQFCRKPTVTGQVTMEHCTEKELRECLPSGGQMVSILRAWRDSEQNVMAWEKKRSIDGTYPLDWKKIKPTRKLQTHRRI